MYECWCFLYFRAFLYASWAALRMTGKFQATVSGAGCFHAHLLHDDNKGARCCYWVPIMCQPTSARQHAPTIDTYLHPRARGVR